MAEVTTTTDFVPINPVYYWTQRVLPLVYEDSLSRSEIIGKITFTLNELIRNCNLIPDLIAQMIKDYITSGAIEGVITEILLNTMINVKYPPNGLKPAKGDGTTDDTATIQGCIDYAATVGGMVLIPYGKYLTGSLEMKSNTALVGNDKYCSILVAKGGINNPFIGGNVYNFSLRNLTIDAQGAFQVNTVDGVSMTVNDVHFDNLIIKNANTSMLLEKTGGQIELNNILFDTATDSHLVIGGTAGHINANTLFLESLSKLGATVAMVSDANGDVYDNIYINSIVPVGLQLDGDNNVFKGIISGKAVKNVENNGDNNNITVDGVFDDKSYSSYMSFKTVGYTEEIMGTRISNSQSSSESVTNTKVVNAKDIVLNPTNPLIYKAPIPYNETISYIEFKDPNDNVYKIPTFTDKFSSLPVYIATDYGIIGDGATDNRENFYKLFDIVKAAGGGTVILPKGTYYVSDCVFIPPNTNFIGEGFNSFVFLNATSSDLGAPLATGGDNITVYNIRVGFLNDDKPLTGALDLTGLAMTSYPYENGKVNDFTVSENYSNLIFSNIFCTGRNALQNEPAPNGSVSNFAYLNIYTPNASVTISGTKNSMTNFGTVNNVICNLFRIGFGDNGSLGINVSNLKAFYCRLLDDNINLTNSLIYQDTEANLIYQANNYTEALLTFGKGIRISNTNVIGNRLTKTLYGIENNEGQPEAVYYTNVKAIGFITNNYHSTSGVKNFLVNCAFNDANNTPSVIFGDCINVVANFNTQAKFSNYNDVREAGFAYATGWTNTSGTYPATFIKEGKFNILKILATYTGSDFASNQVIGTIPLTAGIPSTNKFVSGSLYKAGEFIYYTVVLEITTTGEVKIFNTGITKTDFDTLIIDSFYMD